MNRSNCRNRTKYIYINPIKFMQSHATPLCYQTYKNTHEIKEAFVIYVQLIKN